MNTKLEILEIGKPHPSLLQGEATEGAYFNLTSLEVVLSHLTESEIQDYRKGDAYFALCYVRNTILLLFKFGNQHWADASFNVHLIPVGLRSFPTITNDSSRIELLLVLTDYSNMTVRAIRTMTLSTEFSRTLLSLVEKQLENPPQSDALGKIYAEYSTGELLNVAVANCKGGS